MRVQSQSPRFHRKDLDSIVKLYQAGAKLFYPSFVKRRSTMNNFDRIGTEGTFPALSVVNEGTSIPELDFRTPFYMDVTPYKYGGVFSVSSEAMETDKYGLITSRSMKLLRAEAKAKEILCADIHNLATSTSLATPDGLAFASASHLYNGGTFSNIVTGNPALSAASLAQAVNEMMYIQVDDEGDPMHYTGPYTLLIHPNNFELATRLVNATKYPTTNNNDPNVAGGFISNVVANPYFTSTTNWSLIADGADRPFVLLDRRAPRIEQKEGGDFRKDGEAFRITSMFTRYAEDPRGFIFSGA